MSTRAVLMLCGHVCQMIEEGEPGDTLTETILASHVCPSCALGLRDPLTVRIDPPDDDGEQVH